MTQDSADRRAMSDRVTFSVVIPTFGGRGAALLGRLLESMSRAVLPRSLEGIHVVENGPKADAEALCSRFADRLPLRYHYSSLAGASVARNLGARAVESDFIVFFDDDIRVAEGVFTAYADAFGMFDPARHFFGGPTAIDYERVPDAALVEFLPNSARGFSIDLDRPDVMPLGSRFLGANHAVPRSLFLSLKGYDDLGAAGVNAGPVGEETRLQDRLIEAGVLPVYVPGALVWHHVPADSCDENWLRKRYARYGYTYAMLDAASVPPGRSLFGVPLWLYKVRLGKLSRRLRLALSGAPRRERLQAMLEDDEFAGRMMAYRDRDRGRSPSGT